MHMVVITTYGIAILSCAALFGITVSFFLAPGLDRISERNSLEFFQRLVPHVRRVTALLTASRFALIVLLLVLTFQQWTSTGYWLTTTALILGIVSTFLALGRSLPLSRQISNWSADDLPTGWEQVRRWLRYQRIRAVAELACFALLLVSALLQCSTPSPEAAADSMVQSPARRWEATVLLPLADNEGQSFADVTWQEALAVLVTPFGGATLGEPLDG